MKLIVGLGNPGRKYHGTRHNIGFDVLAEMARQFDAGRPKSKFNAELCETVIHNEKTVLISPLTFMNLSGQSVRAAVDFYKTELQELLVICDDLALDVGRIRLKPSGSAGGQKGLQNIIERLGSNQFSRLRIGIGNTPAGWDSANYVLGKFTTEEQPVIEATIQRATRAIETWITDGIQSAMNQFNADPNPSKKKSTDESRSAENCAANDSDDRIKDAEKTQTRLRETKKGSDCG